MNSQNVLWYIVVALGGIFLYDYWIAPVHKASPVEISQDVLFSTPFPENNILQLHTPNSRFSIDKTTGNIIQSTMLKYDAQVEGTRKVQLLDAQLNNPLIVTLGVEHDVSSYTVQYWDQHKGGKLLGHLASGLLVEKNYELLADGYTVRVMVKIMNPTSHVIKQRFVMRYLSQRLTPQDGASMPKPSDFIPGTDESPSQSWFSFNTFSGLAYHDTDKPYTKFTYAKLAQNPLKKLVKEPWIALQKRYFVTALIPSFDRAYELTTEWKEGVKTSSFFDQRFSASLSSLSFDLKQGEVSQQEVKVYTGPEDAALLKAIAPKLDLTIDFGIFWILCDSLLWLLQNTFLLTKNWGNAIIGITLLLRLAFYKMSEQGFISMRRLKQVGPKVQKLQEKYKDDDAKKNQEILQLYKEEKINPLTGCLPVLLPLPFMMGLYYVLLEAIELRHVAYLWLSDLSSPDPLYILPILMTAVMYVQQSMTPVDDSQKPMMMVMPLMFGFMSLQFPSGLVLFYFVNTALGLLQQWWFMRRFNT